MSKKQRSTPSQKSAKGDPVAKPEPSESTRSGEAPSSAGPEAKLASDLGSSGEEQEAGLNQRKHQRASLSLLVQYRFDTFDDFLGEYASDISLGGMFIRTETPRPTGSMIYLQFSLKDGSTLIEGLGKVCHVTPPGGERPAGMGVEFLNFDEESRSFIESLVQDNADARSKTSED